MKEIFSSATKIVLLLITLAMIGGLFIGKVTGAEFLVLATVVYMFYFKKDTSVVKK